MKRIMAAALALIMMLTMLVSCTESQESLDFKTNIRLMFPYIIRIDYNYIADNPQYQDIFDSIDISGKYVFDGSSYMMKIEGEGTDTEIIILEDVVYSKENQRLKKATLDDENREKMIEMLEEDEADVFDPELYDSVDLMKKGNVYTLTCSDPSDEGKEVLKESIESGNGVGVTWSDVKYVAVYENGVCTSQKLSIPMKISNSGLSIKYTMEIVYNYDYESKVEKIKAPKKADKYVETDIEEIFGDGKKESSGNNSNM